MDGEGDAFFALLLRKKFLHSPAWQDFCLSHFSRYTLTRTNDMFEGKKRFLISLVFSFLFHLLTI